MYSKLNWNGTNSISRKVVYKAPRRKKALNLNIFKFKTTFYSISLNSFIKHREFRGPIVTRLYFLVVYTYFLSYRLQFSLLSCCKMIEYSVTDVNIVELPTAKRADLVTAGLDHFVFESYRPNHGSFSHLASAALLGFNSRPFCRSSESHHYASHDIEILTIFPQVHLFAIDLYLKIEI